MAPSRPASKWRDARFVLLATSLIALELFLIFGTSFGEPAHRAGRHQLWVGDVAGDVRLAQVLWSDVAGIDAVSVTVRASDRVPAESVEFLLKDEDTGTVLARGNVVLPAAVTNPAGARLVWTIGRPLETRRRLLRLEIAMPDGANGHGISVLATPDSSKYAAGRLWLGPREQWGDLVFETSAAYANPWNGLARGLARDVPGPLGLVAFGAASALYTGALLVFVRALLA